MYHFCTVVAQNAEGKTILRHRRDKKHGFLCCGTSSLEQPSYKWVSVAKSEL